MTHTNSADRGAAEKMLDMVEALAAYPVTGVSNGTLAKQFGFTQDRVVGGSAGADPKKIVGHIVKFKHMTHGVKDKPRFPTYVSHRLKTDMEKV